MNKTLRQDPIANHIAQQTPGYTLTAPFYTDEALFAIDIEQIFRKEWLFVGHVGRIPNPGDYFTYQIGKDPWIIVRAEDGSVKAVSNICRHKGSLICREGSGNVRKFVCPYHQWVYEKDGRLSHARLMPTDFNTEAFSLLTATVHATQGMIFVCLADDPPPFPEPNGAVLAPYDLPDAKVAHIASYNVQANWKIILENFMECYHCGVVHPEYSRVMAGASSSYLSEEDITAQAGRSPAEARKESELLGLPTNRWTMQFKQGSCTQSMEGQPVAPLMGTYPAYDGAMIAVWIGWTFEMEANPDYCVVFRFTPLQAMCTNIEATWLVQGEAKEGIDYDRERLVSFWKVTGEQDWDICEVVQQGVLSHYYRPGPLSNAERGPIDFLQEYLRRLSDLP
jgi:Rieske 2Fe-2S family protein